MLAGGEGDEQKAYDYINAFLADGTADYLVNSWGYGHSNQAAMDKIDPEVLAGMGYDNVEAFRENTLWQAPSPTALRGKMIAEFEKIKAGFLQSLRPPNDQATPHRRLSLSYGVGPETGFLPGPT